MIRFATALAVAALALVGAATGAEPQGRVIRAEPQVQPAAPGEARAAPAARRAAPGRVKHVLLGRPDPEEIARALKPHGKPGVPLQIGTGREIKALESVAGLRSWLDWEELADGTRVAAISITSPDASALRMGLRLGELPPEATLRFYSPGEEAVVEVSGREVLEAIARNAAAGEHGPEASTFWSPVVEGPAAVIELELPPSARIQDVRFSIPQVSHLVTSARTGFAIPKVADACNLDAVCSAPTWGPENNAVARMLYSSGGNSFLCTGTLLNDLDGATSIPYFLSANHCISSQSAATSLNTYWFYRSTACNSGVPGSFQTLGSGATLLYANGATDTSFMRLNATPPAGALFAGWSVSVPSVSAGITGIHHPTGDLLKISFGSVIGYDICTPVGSNGFVCNSASIANARFYRVGWTSGVTQGGSSGSAMFANNGHYVIGQLYGGSSSCASPAGPDFYGRFDVAYNAALSQWLAAPPPVPTLIVMRAGSGTGSVTSAPAGINCPSTCSAPFSPGAPITLTAAPGIDSAFSGWTGGSCAGTAPCTFTFTETTTVTANFAFVPPPPANDNFVNRIPLFGAAASSNGGNAGATKEAGEPDHVGNAGGKSAWWSWTAPSSGQAMIHTSGSNFDTLLAVYTGTSVGALTPIASNDDVGGGALVCSLRPVGAVVWGRWGGGTTRPI